MAAHAFGDALAGLGEFVVPEGAEADFGSDFLGIFSDPVWEKVNYKKLSTKKCCLSTCARLWLAHASTNVLIGEIYSRFLQRKH